MEGNQKGTMVKLELTLSTQGKQTASVDSEFTSVVAPVLLLLVVELLQSNVTTLNI